LFTRWHHQNLPAGLPLALAHWFYKLPLALAYWLYKLPLALASGEGDLRKMALAKSKRETSFWL
jgi:hypothetical protein